jgi:hypothetical protein
MNRPITAALSLAGLVVACGLAGCNSSDTGAHGGPEPRQEPYRSGWIRMGHWGIGPIRALTYFEQPVIQALFPTSKVKEVTLRIADDDTEDGIIVTQNGIPLLEIDDGSGNAPGTDDPLIGQVRVLGGPVVGPRGEQLSMGWPDAHFDLSQCEIGVDRDRNSVICARRGEGAITYIFAVPGWDSEEVPPESLLRKVAFLKEIVWTPPPPGAASASAHSAPASAPAH